MDREQRQQVQWIANLCDVVLGPDRMEVSGGGASGGVRMWEYEQAEYVARIEIIARRLHEELVMPEGDERCARN